MKLDSPFAYFGGKKKIAAKVWERLGDPPNYVEPFFGSGAMLLQRPQIGKIETVNDKDGFISNFWRSIQHDPEQTAYYADNPVNENDLHARHSWLLGQKESIVSKLEGDMEYYDCKIAGWWVWGMACWIGGGFCSGNGPWVVNNGELINGGMGGINRKRVHLSSSQGISRKRAHLSTSQGINRQRVQLSGGNGVKRISLKNDGIYNWFESLAIRLKDVRVCSGDWSRICGPSPTWQLGMTGVFLDPPYSTSERDDGLYCTDSMTVAKDVLRWCIDNGDNPLLRIALCGYEGEHVLPESWEVLHWRAHGGYGLLGDARGRENRHKETIWFSPACLKASEQTFWNMAKGE